MSATACVAIYQAPQSAYDVRGTNTYRCFGDALADQLNRSLTRLLCSTRVVKFILALPRQPEGSSPIWAFTAPTDKLLPTSLRLSPIPASVSSNLDSKNKFPRPLTNSRPPGRVARRMLSSSVILSNTRRSIQSVGNNWRSSSLPEGCSNLLMCKAPLIPYLTC
jgi:hypothetical protein